MSLSLFAVLNLLFSGFALGVSTMCLVAALSVILAAAFVVALAEQVAIMIGAAFRTLVKRGDDDGA